MVRKAGGVLPVALPVAIMVGLSAASGQTAESLPSSHHALGGSGGTLAINPDTGGQMLLHMTTTGRRSFAVWREPTVGAFSVVFPAGWTADGALSQGNLFSVRARSPDGQFQILIGDPTAALPAAQGLPIVADGPLGAGDPPAAERVAAAFARARLCPQATALVEAEQREMSLAMTAELPRQGASRQFRLASGGVTFACGPTRGGAVSAVVLQVDNGHRLVPLIVGVLGPTDRQAEALDDLRMVLLTFHFDEAWLKANTSPAMAGVWPAIRGPLGAQAQRELESLGLK